MNRVVCVGTAVLLLAAPAAAQNVTLGVQVIDLTPSRQPENVKVQGVSARSVADNLGLRTGDLFVQINDRSITLASDLDQSRSATVLNVIWRSGNDYYRNVAYVVQQKLDGPEYQVDLPPGTMDMTTVQERVPTTEYRQETRTIVVNGMHRTVTVTVPVTTYRTVTRQVIRPQRRLGITVQPGTGGDVVQTVDANVPAVRGTVIASGQPVVVRLEPGDLILPGGRMGLPDGPLTGALQRATNSRVTLSVRDARSGRVNAITFDLDPHGTVLADARRRGAATAAPPPR